MHCQLPCPIIKRKSAGSCVYLCHHSNGYIHWHPHLPHLPATEVHQAVEDAKSGFGAEKTEQKTDQQASTE